jgi:tRNA A-37 threonylcarbamoyl transferase component Bud32
MYSIVIFRGAIYAALQKMHLAGWAHNDVVDDGSRYLRNLLWNSEGRPVLIDFVTATRHTCNEGCSELMRLQKALKLTNYDLAIWAR